MVVFACPSCAKPFQVKDELFGKKIQCPFCRRVCRVMPPGTDALVSLSVNPAGTQQTDDTQAQAGDVPPAAHPKDSSDETLAYEGNRPLPAAQDTADAAGAGQTAPLQEPPAEATARQTRSLSEVPSTATVSLMAGNQTIPAHPADEVPLPNRIGRFLIRRCLGEGAFGRVYQAHDPQLDRLVALKVAKLDRGDAEQRVKRFLREAKAAAGLRHPHIVPLFEFGHDGDQFFMAAAFIQGRTLKEEIEERKKAGAADLGSAARIVRQLAEALAYAHAQGIVHRDVKPANTLLDDKGEPYLMDFGLASRQEEAEKLTHAGVVLGTPLYMAPEQAQGKEGLANPASDQYSLGVMLYELLTGHTPFEGKPELVMFHHVETEPASPRKLNPRIPRDLETICLKCLQKDPKKRYADCQALANDLRRWQDGEPILARRESVLVRGWRSVRRRPLTVAALLGLLLVLGCAASAWFYVSSTRRVTDLAREVNARQEGNLWDLAERAKSEQLLADLEQLDPEEGSAARLRFHERFARFLKEKLPNLPLTAENLASIQSDLQWLQARNAALATPLSALLAQRQRGRNIVLDLKEPFAKAEEIFAKKMDRRNQHALKWSDAAKSDILPTNIASSGPVEIEAVFAESWESAPAIGVVLNLTLGHAAPIQFIQFSADGKYLASVDAGGGLKLWETATGAEVRTLPLTDDRCHAVAFSPDSEILAAGCEHGVRLWKVADGKELSSLALPRESVHALAYSPNGQLLALGYSAKVLLWDIKAGGVLVQGEQKGPFRQLVFQADGSQCIAVGDQGEVKLWNVQGKPPQTALTKAAAVAPNGKLAVHVADNQCVITELGSGKEIARFANQGDRFAFSADGQFFMQLRGELLYAHGLSTDKEEFAWSTQYSYFSSFAIAPNSRLIATGSLAGTLTLWEIDKTLPRMTLGGHHYLFRLRPGGKQEDKLEGVFKSFAQAKAVAAPMTMEIVRNGISLRQELIPYPSGPLRLRAQREGGKLVFQVNQQSEIAFYDPFPLRSTQAGVFGILWPRQVGLLQLQGTTLGLPTQPSAIEKADDLFDQARYADALPLYEGLLGAAAAQQAQEARYKAGACYVQLNRLDDAARFLEPLVVEKGEQWPLLAAMQLWQIRAQQKRFEDIEALLIVLHRRFGVKDYSQFIPESMQHTLLESLNTQPSDYVSPGLAHIQKAEQFLALAKLFQRGDRLLLGRYNVLATYAYSGQNDKALQTAKEFLHDLEAMARASQMHWIYPFGTRRALWIMRRQGEIGPALEQLDRILFEAPNVVRSVDPRQPKYLTMLYLDRARLFYAQGKLDEAEANLDSFFAQYPPGHAYAYVANGYLMKGFLLEKRGKKAEALQAWQAGLYGSYVQRQPAAQRGAMASLPDREGLLIHGVLASLTGELPDAEADAMRERILATVGKSPFMKQAAQLFRISPGLFREMWRSRLGKIWAEKLAFLDLSLPEFYRLPPRVLALEKVRQEGTPGPLSAEQEDMIWQGIFLSTEGIYTGKIDQAQAFQLAMTWKGFTNFLGWGGVARDLDPAVRGPVAYLLGLRLVREKKMAEAELLLRTAVQDAAPNTALRRLAQAELDRLKPPGKKSAGK